MITISCKVYAQDRLGKLRRDFVRGQANRPRPIRMPCSDIRELSITRVPPTKQSMTSTDTRPTGPSRLLPQHSRRAVRKALHETHRIDTGSPLQGHMLRRSPQNLHHARNKKRSSQRPELQGLSGDTNTRTPDRRPVNWSFSQRLPSDLR